MSACMPEIALTVVLAELRKLKGMASGNHLGEAREAKREAARRTNEA